jgi:predicted transcriptional regulator
MNEETIIQIFEARLEADYRQLAVTTNERFLYSSAAHILSDSKASSTLYVSRQLGMNCQQTRKHLRRMEKMGYVQADSNGFNNIYWSLKP